MTNFEYYAQDPSVLDTLLYAAVGDALRAKGCSLKLKFPPDDCADWETWLNQEYDGGLTLPPMFPEPPQSETAEQYNVRIITDKLEEIKAAVAHIQTPFEQAVRDILDEAAENVQALAGGGSNA